MITKLFGETHNPAPLADLPPVNLDLGATFANDAIKEDLAVL